MTSLAFALPIACKTFAANWTASWCNRTVSLEDTVKAQQVIATLGMYLIYWTQSHSWSGLGLAQKAETDDDLQHSEDSENEENCRS